MQADRTLITTGTIGAVIAAICCATPLLAIVFGTLGLTAWLASADFVLIPALLICSGWSASGSIAAAQQLKLVAIRPLRNKASNHE